MRPGKQKSLRKGGPVTSLFEGFLALAQLAFAALVEITEAAGLAGSCGGVRLRVAFPWGQEQNTNVSGRRLWGEGGLGLAWRTGVGV